MADQLNAYFISNHGYMIKLRPPISLAWAVSLVRLPKCVPSNDYATPAPSPFARPPYARQMAVPTLMMTHARMTHPMHATDVPLAACSCEHLVGLIDR